MLILCSPDPEQHERWQKALQGRPGRYRVCERLEELDSALPGDTVLLDIVKAGRSLDSLLALIEAHPALRFMVFSPTHEPEEGVRFIKAGARGYANRYMHPDLLPQALGLIEAGEIWLGSELVLHLIRENAPVNGHAAAAAEKLATNSLGGLTTRERDTATRVAQGKSNKVIASELGVTERTIKAHLSSIYRKTGARDRLQLAMLIREQA